MINIVKYPWHTAHDYELFKLRHQFQVLNGTHREWGAATRPLPDNIKYISSLEHCSADLMILHVDQWIFDEPDKLLLFKKLSRRFSGKKIVINHGCNLVDGASSERMEELIGEFPVVCNSSTAHKCWNLPNSRYIHHGMSPDEWNHSNYGHNNIITIQPHGKMHSEFRNNQALAVFENKTGEKITWVGRDKKFKSFGAYKSFLATSSIAFFPSYASPNPRARTESMFSGLAVVTTNSQGENNYIENEVNGYASNNMNELFEYILHLKNNPDEVKRIGANARQTASEHFNISRFLNDWEGLIDEVIAA